MSVIVDFFHRLDSAVDESTFKELCKLEREKVGKSYSTIQSMKWRFSQYRSYLRDEYYKDKDVIGQAVKQVDFFKKQGNSIDDSIILSATCYALSLAELQEEYLKYSNILSYLKITDLETKKIKEDYNASVKNRRSNLQYILDVNGYIKKAVDLAKCNNFINNILGLAALTGRRVAEIGCTAQFEYVNDCTLSFRGQLKTKDIDSCSVIEIPALFDSELIISSLKNLRSNFSQYINNPEKFHNNCSTSLSKKSHQFESFVEGKVTPKDLRAIYAPIAYKRYCKNDRMDDTVYYSTILGHNEKDDNTCLSYTKYKIK